jgi:hypothetical protein
VPAAKVYDKYINTMGEKANGNDSLGQRFYPLSLFTDERISFKNDDESTTELPTMSIGYDKNWEEGLIKLVTAEDLTMSPTNSTQLLSVNFQINKESKHWKNSAAFSYINSVAPSKRKTVEADFDRIFFEVFSSKRSLFQRNMVKVINDIYSQSLKTPAANTFKDISDCTVKLINPNNYELFEQNKKKKEDTPVYRNWISNNTDDLDLVPIVAKTVKSETATAATNLREFWVQRDTNSNHRVDYDRWKDMSPILGYNGQIGYMQGYRLTIDGVLQDKIQYAYFYSYYEYQSKNTTDFHLTENFFDMSVSFNDLKDFLFNENKSDILSPGFAFNAIYGKISTDYDLCEKFINYYLAILGKQNGLDIMKRSQISSWDISKDKTYKIVNATDVMFNEQMKIYQSQKEFDENNWNDDQVLISPGFYKANKLKMGDEIKLGNQWAVISGIATDSYNLYPTVHDSDYVSDANKQAVVYATSGMMARILKDETFTNYSTQNYILMKNNTNEKIEDNINGFYSSFLETPTNIAIKNTKNFDQLTSYYLGYKMINYTMTIFQIVMYFFAAIFLIISIVISMIVILDIVNSQKIVIGNLKANGASFLNVTSSYYLYLLIVALIAIPVGFGMSIGILILILKTFSMFFGIGFLFSVSIPAFAIMFVVMIVFMLVVLTIVLVKKIQVPVLRLLNNEATEKNVKVRKLNLASKRTFTSKISGSLLQRNALKLFLLSGLFFITSLVMIVSAIFSIYFINYNNNKFETYNYGSRTTYSNMIIGNPFNKIKTYEFDDKFKNNSDKNLESEILPSEIKTSEGKTIKISDLKNVYGQEYIGMIKNWITESVIASYQKNISIKYFDYIANTLVGGSESDTSSQEYSNYRMISEYISGLLAQILPKTLNLDAVSYDPYPTASSRGTSTLREAYLDVWKDILTSIANQKLNDEAKVIWSEEKSNLDNFVFSFNTTPFNDSKQEKYTSVDLMEGNQTFELIGQSQNSKLGFKNLDVNKLNIENKNSDTLHVLASKKYLNTHDSRDNLSFNTKENKLQFSNGLVNSNEIKWNDFSDDGNNVGQWMIADLNDANKFEKLNDAENAGYFATLLKGNDEKLFDANGRQYANLNDIVLKISESSINTDDTSLWKQNFSNDGVNINSKLSSLLDVDSNVKIYESNGSEVNIVSKENGNYYIHPFSIGFSSDSLNITNLGMTWYDAAQKLGLIKVNTVEKQIRIKIDGSFNNYGSNVFVTDQSSLNNIFEQGNNENWFNGLFSTEKIPNDTKWNYGLSNQNANITINGINKLKNKNKSTEYITFEREIIKRVVNLTIEVGAMIYILMLFLLTICVAFIIKIFVEGFKNFILVLRATGYDFKSINKILLTLLLPFSLLGWVLGTGIGLGLMDGISKIVLNKFNIIIPIGTGVTLIPFTFAILAIVLGATYGLIIERIKKMNVNEITAG